MEGPAQRLADDGDGLARVVAPERHPDAPAVPRDGGHGPAKPAPAGHAHRVDAEADARPRSRGTRPPARTRRSARRAPAAAPWCCSASVQNKPPMPPPITATRKGRPGSAAAAGEDGGCHVLRRAATFVVRKESVLVDAGNARGIFEMKRSVKHHRTQHATMSREEKEKKKQNCGLPSSAGGLPRNKNTRAEQGVPCFSTPF